MTERIGLAIMGLFSFAESPQLQALLADVVPTALRDVTFALYFTLAFGVGSLWTAGYGVVIDVLAGLHAAHEALQDRQDGREIFSSYYQVGADWLGGSRHLSMASIPRGAVL